MLIGEYLYNKCMPPLQLSIIVPVFNEEETLPALFATLSRQKGVPFELIISDGGSTDDSVALARRQGEKATFPVTVIQGGQGRGAQMDAGAAASRGETLLFSHADSRFNDTNALRSAMEMLERRIEERGDERVSGRFSLIFDRQDPSPSLAYYYYESKARLNRPECTHGDQGYMLRRSYLNEAGPFAGPLPMLSETRFAEAARQKGEWLLFPAEIVTSSRRFEREGFYERQLLNAIIMNFASMEWETFFQELPGIYSTHREGGRILLGAMLKRISRLISGLPPRRRMSLWYSTGVYVRSHAWQIPFFLDTRRNFFRRLPPGKGETPLLSLYDRYMDRLTDHSPGCLIAALLTWIWFRLTCLLTPTEMR